MLSDGTAVQASSGTTSVAQETIPEGSTIGNHNMANGRPHSKSLSTAVNGNGNFPPPKTDKPRPHVCGTCGRSFARLEHLKRHERSHTKEKPFECPECTRCFARRDLLLRHQQKLHMTTTPSSRPRSGRRESTSSSVAGTAKVRKTSGTNSGTGGPGGNTMRPRANTISHVDNTTLHMLAAANAAGASGIRHGQMNLNHNLHASLNPMRGPGAYEFRSMSNSVGHHGNHELPKLETHGLNIDMGGSLRTAPPFGGFESDFGMDNIIFGPGSTINPAQLHFSDSPSSLAFDTPASPFSQGFSGLQPTPASMEESTNFEWMNGFEHQMSFNNMNENAIAGSSPSAISTGSPGGISEVMLDGSNNHAQSTAMWQNSVLAQTSMADFQMDLSVSSFPDLLATGPLSPKTLQDHLTGADQYFASPPPPNHQREMTPMHGLHNQFYHPPMVINADTPTTSAASVSSSAHRSSVTSVSTESITDATRQALLLSLSQPSLFSHNHRKYSQPTMSSPLSPGFSARPQSGSGVLLPSTYDLQRYVAAYIQYFHPHLPFLHIPTLSFDSPAYTSSLRTNGHNNIHYPGIAGGGGCLILAMAAIGALYEFETAASKELFEMAKRMIQLYLEERRKADMSAALNGSNGIGQNAAQNTPLWLVQAMLLNVIYGHNCGDKTAADIASTHCAALVSLARAAELPTPFTSGSSADADFLQRQGGLPMGQDTLMGNDGWSLNTSQGASDDRSAWYRWKVAEERKRTLYAVFILSSMLVSAYNHAPALMNSEIRLDLPCEEELWAAESPAAWYGQSLTAVTEQKNISFASALSSLLTASQRQQQSQHSLYSQPNSSGFFMPNLPPSDFQPSTFGCLVLINALHNYIWETRQRHLGRQWTTQETESMHTHIEPALVAWQAAWASNSHHSFERPNPFGFGPLSADCIPLLDLAYVRLFVNLGRSKEAFWQRDYDGMADELARGSEIIQHADHSPLSPSSNSDSSTSRLGNSSTSDGSRIKMEPGLSSDLSHREQSPGQSGKRERHLRKAAFHAARSLSQSDKLGTTFADFNSRELPISSAMTAYDCAQVLAEWVSTVQDRVGRHLGVLGRDPMDLGQIPFVMYLSDEDTELLTKMDQIINNASMKMTVDQSDIGNMAGSVSANWLSGLEGCGYGTKILLVTAYMLEKAAVWPVTRLMARSLETQAAHTKDRADKSLMEYE